MGTYQPIATKNLMFKFLHGVGSAQEHDHCLPGEDRVSGGCVGVFTEPWKWMREKKAKEKEDV